MNNFANLYGLHVHDFFTLLYNHQSAQDSPSLSLCYFLSTSSLLDNLTFVIQGQLLDGPTHL